MSVNDGRPTKTALSSAEIKDAILYKLVSIALQVANDPRDADDLGKLVNALEEAIDNGR